uniref:hypothetical protein n=1 Tax=Thiolapillus sp. TaxID=2017437 RepID=UPI003AF73824
MLDEENVLVYIAGYVAKILFSKTCLQCNELSQTPLTGSESELLLVNKGSGLVVPSSQLIKVLETMESMWIKNIDKILHEDSLKIHLTKLLQQQLQDSELTCPSGTCDLKAHVIHLFISVRLHSTLK